MSNPKQELSLIEQCENTLEEACIAFEEADVETREIRRETAKLRQQKEAAWETIRQMKAQIAEMRNEHKPRLTLTPTYKELENASDNPDSQERPWLRKVLGRGRQGRDVQAGGRVGRRFGG